MRPKASKPKPMNWSEPPVNPRALLVKDVKFRWAKAAQPVLDIPEFAVRAGERVLIKGASGSGKTTLLNLLAGVVLPSYGLVEVAGVALNDLGGASRDKFRADHIGFVFQLFNLLPYLSIVENVILPCRFSRARRTRAIARSPSLAEEAQRLVSHMGLDISRDGLRSVAELSIGQQQRVAAARALIGAPELIIADEPTSALDSESRDQFLSLLFEEAEANGITVLAVSHDEAMMRVFSRVVSLNDINHVTV